VHGGSHVLLPGAQVIGPLPGDQIPGQGDRARKGAMAAYLPGQERDSP